MSAALLHINEAIEHLGIAVECISPTGEELPGHLDCMAIELERIDRALGGNTLLSPMAEAVRAAFVEILAARDALASEEGR